MDFIGAVGCSDGCAAFQLEKGNKTRISLFYGYGHARETVRSGFVVGSSGAWPGYEGQGKMHLCLAYHPYAKLSPGMVAEKDKARHVAKSCAGGKICDVFSRKHFHECLVGAYELGEKGGRDRKSTRLNSSHGYISYAVFCLKKKKQKHNDLFHEKKKKKKKNEN